MDTGYESLSIIIVSYNTCELTLNCLQTVCGELADWSPEIWVVDNASQDGSAAAIRSRFPNVRLIANEHNVGFGAANNQAMKLATGSYFLLLNSDAFPKQGAIRALIEYIKDRPDVGVVGPRLLNRDGTLQLSCFRFPTPFRCWLENLWLTVIFRNHPSLTNYRHWPHDQERVVETVSGACMLVRRQAYDQVGGFDEHFFLYSEEVDWQRRIADAGWKIAFTPTAEVTHLAGASGANEPARISEHFFNSLDYYEWKHHGIAGLIALRAGMIVGCSLRFILWALVLVFKPGRRVVAASKAKLHLWLVWRQATRWTLATRNR